MNRRTITSPVIPWAALMVAIIALIMSMTGVGAAHSRTGSGQHGQPRGKLVRTGKDGVIPADLLPKIPASDLPTIPAGELPKIPANRLPTVNQAKNAATLDGKTEVQLVSTCPPSTVDIGTWCLDQSVYAPTATQTGATNYFFASRVCESLGGYLPTAAQLIGAANKVPLESVLGDSPTTATVDQDPTNGLSDLREMSSTLVTVAAGSDAAGSEGVSQGATGNPVLGAPNPIPEPAVPDPETLQYVTVYDNFQKGGFAGSEPVSAPENFRCAFNKVSKIAMTGS